MRRGPAPTTRALTALSTTTAVTSGMIAMPITVTNPWITRTAMLVPVSGWAAPAESSTAR
jgi:hypothetical protein